MTLIATCSRVGCEETTEIDWMRAPRSVRDLAIRDEPEYSELIYVYLPRAWAVDQNGLDYVIHCPEHAQERGS
jgi:hypothetical protein